MNFIWKCLTGRAKPEQIDDYVEDWHKNPNTALILSEYLGMSHEEYTKWVLNPPVLYTILDNRRNSNVYEYRLALINHVLMSQHLKNMPLSLNVKSNDEWVILYHPTEPPIKDLPTDSAWVVATFCFANNELSIVNDNKAIISYPIDRIDRDILATVLEVLINQKMPKFLQTP